ncbi:mitogen-activated protein kinase kinase kinase 3-like [Actinia tenebrosa]|uniref:Mitogen-activated protein kinase kinase kinase 3-like n=1 Tax=Actinia tenebrosa TaxID=6105 RepID=A0A6P8I039_ACTTE|nr:mitogen-activated protein kinase kinase kinase 3-like [Actinia tenebrosa]
MLGIAIKSKDILLVTEFVDGESLQGVIEEEKNLTEEFRINVIVGVLVSCKHHIAKLCDFGLGKLKQHATLSVASVTIGESVLEGTLLYMAPECFLKKEHVSQESDIWSLAITFPEFLAYEDVWNEVLEGMGEDSVMEKLISIAKAKTLPNSLNKLSPAHRTHIQMCLNCNKIERPTALQLLKLEW